MDIVYYIFLVLKLLVSGNLVIYIVKHITTKYHSVLRPLRQDRRWNWSYFVWVINATCIPLEEIKFKSLNLRNNVFIFLFNKYIFKRYLKPNLKSACAAQLKPLAEILERQYKYVLKITPEYIAFKHFRSFY